MNNSVLIMNFGILKIKNTELFQQKSPLHLNGIIKDAMSCTHIRVKIKLFFLVPNENYLY